MRCLCKFTFQASHLLSTSAPKSDIDSAAKFIGAGEKSALARALCKEFLVTLSHQVLPPWVLLDPALELAQFLAPSSLAMPGEAAEFQGRLVYFACHKIWRNVC